MDEYKYMFPGMVVETITNNPAYKDSWADDEILVYISHLDEEYFDESVDSMFSILEVINGNVGYNDSCNSKEIETEIENICKKEFPNKRVIFFVEENYKYMNFLRFKLSLL